LSLVRLGSVTHAIDMNQRFIPVPFTGSGATLTATLPAEPGVCLPGHYMLFALTAAGCRRWRRSSGSPSPPTSRPTGPSTAGGPRAARRRRARHPGDGGLTAQCPYGLAACWGGAYEALTALSGVAAVRPYADAADSTADVFLGGDALPDLDAWPEQLARSANGSYAFRGVELTVAGDVVRDGDDLVLVAEHRPPIALRPLEQVLAWDLAARRPRSATAEERARSGTSRKAKRCR
jgi:hypothetical protein